MADTHSHVCSLCEAGCGLHVQVEAGRVREVRPNSNDVLSSGYVCPKGIALAALEEDPDRLRGPVRRREDGSFEPIAWDEAFELVARELRAIQREHGRDAVAVYTGTPVVHKHSALLMRTALMSTLRTHNSFSAGTQDIAPRCATSHLLYGNAMSLPVPDIDRTQYFLCFGANPVVSNGSLMTAPNMRARLRAIRARGGKIVVVDPRRTETAELADEHVSIRPGGDAALLLAMVQALLVEGRIDEAAVQRTTRGWPRVRPLLASFTPERVERITGVAPETIRRLALEFANAPTSVAYARIGVCNNAFGTLGSYAVDLLNIVTGRMGVVGGSMFATPAIDLPTISRRLGAVGYGRWKSRVRGLPETLGDIPSATLAEEIETDGRGQIRGMITIAGNPVLSVPNGRRVAAALDRLQFHVCVDMYINETSRRAHVILPPVSNLSEEHADMFFANVMVHNAMRWTPSALPRSESERYDWEILLELSYRMGGGPLGVAPIDAIARFAWRHLGYQFSLQNLVDVLVRTGPYGDGFLPWKSGITGAQLRAAPNGVDLGPLQPGLARRIYHFGGRVALAPRVIVDGVSELAGSLDAQASQQELLLIGRRDLRSNNSWMHNLPRLVSGKERCTLLVHPSDAARCGVIDGGQGWMASRTHAGEVRVEVSDEIRPGVVSLPHGWGHRENASFQRVAGATAGVSANDWTDDRDVESLVGQSILNGVPVTLTACSASRASTAS